MAHGHADLIQRHYDIASGIDTLHGCALLGIDDDATIVAKIDAELAREVIATDEKVDAFYNSIFRNLVSHMVENPSTISSAAQMLFVARNLERIGDHATNVAEMVHFAATGTYPLDEDG
mgnify:CR=1 FL=1